MDTNEIVSLCKRIDGLKSTSFTTTKGAYSWEVKLITIDVPTEDDAVSLMNRLNSLIAPVIEELEMKILKRLSDIAAQAPKRKRGGK